MTNLIASGMPMKHTEIGISSLMDSWLEVRAVENNGERNRLLQLLKSRGMGHSNQVREFRLTDLGIDLVDVYLGQNQVLAGTARAAQESADRQ
ncbi:MAG: circadian clock protein KaiC, partial [Nostoc sp.]